MAKKKTKTPKSTPKKTTSSKSGKKSSTAAKTKSRAAKGRGTKKTTPASKPAGKKSLAKKKQLVKPAAAKAGFPIVCIGASAGGLEAMEEFFKNVPAKCGIAFVVVTHQHPGHTSLLPELLGKRTKLSVAQATDGVRLRPNHVYIGPPGGHMAMIDRTLQFLEPKAADVRLPIDYLFRSMAQDQRDRAICVVLSGTGTDGTLGLREVKGVNGMAMVQDLESAKYEGMPHSAIMTKLVDFILPASEMPAQLVKYVEELHLLPSEREVEAEKTPPQPMHQIYLLLRNHTGHDFSGYKNTTIRRRIERRMNVHQIRTPGQYLRYLQHNPHELDVLFKELLINVTSFFRDADAFQSLEKVLQKRVIGPKPEDYALRIWVPACGSGEEAYSIAILLRECMERLNKWLDVQIFGTDLDAEAIDAARIGMYPDGIAVDVDAERLKRFFVREEGGYRIAKEIREMVVFAAQNALQDPPFTKLDLVSCRNFLIYLQTGLQRRLLPVFHYALRPGGFLFLGPSESIGVADGLFKPIDNKWKIYSRVESPVAPRRLIQFPTEPRKAEIPPDEIIPLAEPVRETHLSAIIERLLLQQYAPVSVVINPRGDILYIHGRTGAYLEPSPGQPRNNVLEMAREGLRLELATAVRRAATRNTEVTLNGVKVKANGEYVFTDVSVVKLQDPETVRGLLSVTFRPHVATADTRPKAKKPKTKKEITRVAELERELQFTKETLQSTVEELETSNEEMKSTNEELQSTNEELQSTNEELETSKEEMQSLNEELNTVNAEMQTKLDELNTTSDDMKNLLDSTEVATIFLDTELRVRRFTPKANEIIPLMVTDSGRPIKDLASKLIDTDLAEYSQRVLGDLVVREADAESKDGRSYVMRVRPYRTAANIIDGVVIIFEEITRRKQLEMKVRGELETELRRMSRVFLDGADPIVIEDLDGKIVDLNLATERAYGWKREELIGQPIKKLVAPQRHAQADDLRQQCKAGEGVRNIEGLRCNKAGEVIPVLLTLSLLTDEEGKPIGVANSSKSLAEVKQGPS